MKDYFHPAPAARTDPLGRHEAEADLRNAQIGRLVTDERTRRHMSQNALAAAAGVNRVTVSRVERGGGGTLTTLTALGVALGLPAGWFIDPWRPDLDAIEAQVHADIAMREAGAGPVLRRLTSALLAAAAAGDRFTEVEGMAGRLEIYWLRAEALRAGRDLD